MAEAERYRRLTRSMVRLGDFTSSSLWRGSDHLLLVESSGYTEKYRRFYFRDIQAFVIVASYRRSIWNWVLAAPTVLFGFAGFFAYLVSPGNDSTLLIVAAVIAALSSVPVLVNNLLGPGCVCHIRTAVQFEQLIPVCRLRRARRLLEHIRPLVAERQGLLTREEIPARMRQLAEAASRPAPGAASPATPPYPAEDSNIPPRIT